MEVFFIITIECLNLKKEISGRVLFESEHLTVAKKQRIGIIGVNGSGKTTLINMLLGVDEVYRGKIIKRGTLYYLPQLIDVKSTKSGGEQVKEKLDQAFAHQYDVLLLDEPTTNLDAENIAFLEKRIKHFNGAVIVVSHDRQFLNNICEVTWEIANGMINVFPGKYAEYEAHKEQKKIEQQRKHEKYQQTKQGLEQAIDNKRKSAAKVLNKKSKSNVEDGISKPHYAKKQKKAAKSAKVLERRLANLKEEEKVTVEKEIVITPKSVKTLSNRVLFRFEELSLQIGNRQLIENFTAELKFGEKIALTGANGVGKTTLLRAILTKENQAISIHPEVKIGYFAQNLAILDADKTILETVMEQAIQPEHLVRTMLANLDFNADTLTKRIAVLSGGEKVRIALIKIIVSDINVLILDEPTNYLDYRLLSVLETILKNYQGTLLLVSHDRAFVQNTVEKIWHLENKHITVKSLTESSKISVTNDEQKLLLKIDFKLTELISKLSITPAEALEQEYQTLLEQKRSLISKK